LSALYTSRVYNYNNYYNYDKVANVIRERGGEEAEEEEEKKRKQGS